MARGRSAQVTALGALLLLAAVLAGCGPRTGVQPSADAPPPPAAVAALVDATDDGSLHDAQFCGGSLVSARVVLTAYHCVSELTPADIDVVLGVDDLCADDVPTAARLTVAEIVAGPDGSDSAALVLAAPTDVTPFVLPSAVPAVPFEATSYGWGDLTNLLPGPCTAKTITLTFEDLSACDVAARFDEPVDDAFGLCARPTQDSLLNTCTGDSGGPSVVPVGDRLEVVGLTDWGASCSRRAHGGYVSVAALRPWVDPLVARTGG